MSAGIKVDFNDREVVLSRLAVTCQVPKHLLTVTSVKTDQWLIKPWAFTEKASPVQDHVFQNRDLYILIQVSQLL